MQAPKGVVEECIVQHRDMDVLNPNVVQTIRVMVFKAKKGSRILFTTLRTSTNPESVVDNACGGGVFANINLETGMIQTKAFSKYTIGLTPENMTKDNIISLTTGLDAHPVTGVKFEGFKIPYFEEAKRMVLEIADNVDLFGCRWLAFDVAVAESGPCIVEVNCTRPGFSLWQMPLRNTPLVPVVEELIKED